MTPSDNDGYLSLSPTFPFPCPFMHGLSGHQTECINQRTCRNFCVRQCVQPDSRVCDTLNNFDYPRNFVWLLVHLSTVVLYTIYTTSCSFTHATATAS